MKRRLHRKSGADGDGAARNFPWISRIREWAQHTTYIEPWKILIYLQTLCCFQVTSTRRFFRYGGFLAIYGGEQCKLGAAEIRKVHAPRCVPARGAGGAICG